MTGDGARAGAIARAHAYIDEGGFEEEIARRVAYRTESQKSDSGPELHRYLDDEMIPAFEAMGFACRKYENPFPDGGPFLLAERMEADDLPTVLGYGHGDVIRGLEDQWTKGDGPWRTVRDGDRLYGRGTADNKGQHTVNMAATRIVLEERGRLGFNAKVLIEMGEENGSKGLREVVTENLDDFASDVFIASDGPRVEPDRPTISLGARGATNFDLVCDFREGGHHSGNWGGVLADPGIVLAHAIASIVGPSGEIQIPDWLPPPISNSVRDVLKDVAFTSGEGGPGIDHDWGHPGLTPAEKIYAWNSFAVLAYTSGNPGRPVNAISPRARANCQLRYVAETDPDRIVPALREHLDAAGFGTVTIEPPPPENAAGFSASRTPLDDPWALWVRSTVERNSGRAPAIIPSTGGSICNDIFTDVIGVPSIWLPHSYTGCSQHAPNEHILMSGYRDGMALMTALYWDLGDGGTPPKS